MAMAPDPKDMQRPAQKLSDAELAARMLKGSLLELLKSDDEIRALIRLIAEPATQPADHPPEAAVAQTLLTLVETKIGQLVRPEALRRAIHHAPGPVKSS